MSSFTTGSSSVSKFGIGSRRNVMNYQDGIEATYYQNQTGLMEMNSQNYNSINIDPHELATRAAKNAAMAAAALPEASRQYQLNASGNSSSANQQGLSVRTLQNVLDRQYEGFLQVAAKIAQMHEKADHF